MSIYSDGRKPYFYIIQHKDTGLKYAGAKWAYDANPDNFMIGDGYTTSSSKINDILNDNPGVQFSILDIILEEEIQIPFGALKIEDYEDWFLKTNKCRQSDAWYNRIVGAAFGTDEFYENMINKYGVKHASQIPTTLPKTIATNNIKYGVDWYTQTPDFIVKVKNTNNQKYGADWYAQTDEYNISASATCTLKYNHPTFLGSKENISQLAEWASQYGDYTNCSQIEFVKQKKIDTCNKNFGVDHPMQSEAVKAKSVATCLEKYGVSTYSKTEESKLRQKATRLEKYGDENYCNIEKIEEIFMEKYGVKSSLSVPEVRAKGVATLQQKYGEQYTNAFQIPEIMAKAKIKAENTCLEKYGSKNVSHVEFHCCDCDIHGKGLGSIKRMHKDCKNVFLKIRGEMVKHGN